MNKLFEFLQTKYNKPSQQLFTLLEALPITTIKEIAQSLNTPASTILIYFSQLYVTHVTPELQSLQLNIKYDLFKQIQLNGCLVGILELSKKQCKNFVKLTADEFLDEKNASKFLQFFLTNFMKAVEVSSLADALAAENDQSKSVVSSFKEEYRSLILGLIEQAEIGEEDCCGEEGESEADGEESSDQCSYGEVSEV